MKREHDFSKAVRGKFYRPAMCLNLPIYLDVKSRDAASDIKIGATMSDSASRIRALIEQKKQQERNLEQQKDEQRRNAISQAVLAINEQMVKAALPYLEAMRRVTEKTNCWGVLNSVAKSYRLKRERNGNVRAEAQFWRMIAEYRISGAPRHFVFLVDKDYQIEQLKMDEALIADFLYIINREMTLQAPNIPDVHFIKIIECATGLSWDAHQEWVHKWYDTEEYEWVSSRIHIGLSGDTNVWKLKVNGHELVESEWSQENFEQVIAEIFYSITK